MPKRKWFLKDKELKEFDHITNTFWIILTSIFLMSGGLYGLFVFASTTISGLFFFVIFLAGFFIYALNKSGRDFIDGLIRGRNVSKEGSLNVHLSLGWFITLATVLIVLVMYNGSRFITHGVDFYAFADIATATIIADSVFAVLVSTQLNDFGKRALNLFNSLIISIAVSITTLLVIAFGLPLSVIFVLTSLSIAAMYFVISVFVFLIKATIKKSGESAI